MPDATHLDSLSENSYNFSDDLNPRLKKKSILVVAKTLMRIQNQTRIWINTTKTCLLQMFCEQVNQEKGSDGGFSKET